MGGGIVRVVYKDGKPAPNQKVNIEWNWLGVKTGNMEVYTNNSGVAQFEGVPSSSAGEGKVTDSVGHFVTFTIGSDIFGNFSQKNVTVYWNPVSSTTNATKTAISGAIEWIVGKIIPFAIIIVAIMIVVKLIKRHPIGRVAGGAGSLLTKGRGLLHR